MTPALHDYIQVFDDAFDAAFCRRMIESFDALARFHRGNGRGLREGLEASAWTELDVGAFSDEGFRRIIAANMRHHLERYNAAAPLHIPVPPSDRTSELILKRYRAGGEERFQPHFDSVGDVSNRYLVFLWYLNDVERGGETRFVDLGLDIRPRAGRLLVFPPYWMFQHAGLPPLSGDKFILSTYYLF